MNSARTLTLLNGWLRLTRAIIRRTRGETPAGGEWLGRGLNGFYQYYALPGNWAPETGFACRSDATGGTFSKGAASVVD